MARSHIYLRDRRELRDLRAPARLPAFLADFREDRRDRRLVPAALGAAFLADRRALRAPPRTLGILDISLLLYILRNKK